MKIELDREKRIVLLQALRDGYFDTERFFDEGSAKPVKFMTEDEIEAEITRIDRLNYPGTCQRLKQAGLCLDCNQASSAKVSRTTNHE